MDLACLAMTSELMASTLVVARASAAGRRGISVLIGEEEEEEEELTKALFLCIAAQLKPVLERGGVPNSSGRDGI